MRCASSATRETAGRRCATFTVEVWRRLINNRSTAAAKEKKETSESKKEVVRAKAESIKARTKSAPKGEEEATEAGLLCVVGGGL